MTPSNDFDLAFHENFEDHQAAEGRRVVTCEEASQVWDGGFEYRGNRKDRVSEWLVIGRTAGGRLITIGVVWADDFQVWRAYNGWDTKETDW